MTQGNDQAGALSADTTRHAERLQVIAWRALSSLERARLVAGASRTTRAMTFAGLRQRHPGATEPELVARFALLTLGPALARRVYPQFIDVEIVR